jgi:hypothetical protein
LGYPVEYGQTPIVIGARGGFDPAPRRPPAPCPADRGAADSKPAKRFLACNRRETICGRDEAILSAREDRLKPEPGINEATRTTRFGHVGCHHQPDLPPLVQELSGRRAQTAQTDQPLGLIAKPKRG